METEWKQICHDMVGLWKAHFTAPVQWHPFYRSQEYINFFSIVHIYGHQTVFTYGRIDRF